MKHHVLIELEWTDAADAGYDVGITAAGRPTLWLLHGKLGFKCDEKTGKRILKYVEGAKA